MSDERTPNAGERWQNADDSQHLAGPGANIQVRIIGQDGRLLASVALAVSVLCAFYSFEAGRQMEKAVYWLQRDEAFLEQLANQGYKVPPDLLHKGDRP